MGLKENIKKQRLESNMTLEELSNKVGVSRQTIQRYESGIISNIPSDKIELMAAALGTTPAYLMGWTKEEEVAISGITNEFKKNINRTNLYIQLFESYEYKIALNPTTVDMYSKSGERFIFDRKDFMAMIQRCHKDITYNMDRLINDYKKKNTEPLLNAAHARTDIEVTEEMMQHDNDIMDSDNEWE